MNLSKNVVVVDIEIEVAVEELEEKVAPSIWLPF
jgi:hypothetical protein